jgi:hypothetical protein
MEVRSQSDDPDSFNGRLKALAAAVASLDGRESGALVMEILALRGEWDGSTRAEAIEALLAGGARLDADAVLRVLNPTIERSRVRAFHDQQEAYLLQRCLSLLPFIEPCSVGVARIREVVAATGLVAHELRGITTALGNSRCADAFGLLREFTTISGREFQALAAEWIAAVATPGTPEAKRVLLSFVDPDIQQLNVAQYLEHYHSERIASAIAEIARSDPAVRRRLYDLCTTPLPPAMRTMLAAAVGQMGSGEAILAGLELIHDRADPAIPRGLLQGMENVFLERRPYGSSGHAYTLEPRSANEIRGRLFAMILNDSSRTRSALALLGQIESWRLEYGRPMTEPRHPAIDSGAPWPPIEMA